MGHIKEPNGIDLVIKSRSLTKGEELAISDHIKNYKAKKLGSHKYPTEKKAAGKFEVLNIR